MRSCAIPCIYPEQKTEIEFNTAFTVIVSRSDLVERFECKRSTKTEKYTKADVKLVMLLIRTVTL